MVDKSTRRQRQKPEQPLLGALGILNCAIRMGESSSCPTIKKGLSTNMPQHTQLVHTTLAQAVERAGGLQFCLEPAAVLPV